MTRTAWQERWLRVRLGVRRGRKRFARSAAALLASESFRAGCVSLAVHAMALVVVGLLADRSLPSPGGISRHEIIAEFERDDEDRPGALTPIRIPQELRLSAAGAGDPAFSAETIGAMVANQVQDALSPQFSSVPRVRGGGGRQGLDLTGDELLKQVNEAPGASFFGAKAVGRKFAFVVDRSGSMGEDTRWQRALQELANSLGALAPSQEYFVVFFNRESYPMPGGRLVKAKPAEIRSTLYWCNHMQPQGATDPWPALAHAVKTSPDAIFLLTDGLFADEVAERLMALPPESRVPVHAIGLGIESGSPETRRLAEEQLHFIARVTKGTYRFVP